MKTKPPRWRPPPFLAATLALHAAGAVAWPFLPGLRAAILGALAADHLVICASCMWPRSRLLGPNTCRLPREAAAAGQIGLTFDDGPDPAVTPRVLDLLEERAVRATFFLIGRRAEQHPDLAAEIARRGHRLENHTYHHPNSFAFYSPRAQAREIDRAQTVLERLSGRRPRWFRAPAGIRNPFLDPLLVRRGLRLMSWTHRGYDTVERNPRRVVARLVRGLQAGDVALLHDGSAARDPGGRPVVLEALPRWLDAVTARGLEPVPLPAPRSPRP